MIRITSLKISKDKDINRCLGTSIEILAFTNQDKPYSLKITIKDPTETIVVDNVDMARLNTKVYSYIYQSSSTGQNGEYSIIVTISDGVNSYIAQDTFILEDQL